MKSHYTVSELNNRKAHTSKTGDQGSQVFHVEHLTRAQIEKHYELFRSIIPASTADYDRRRTSYFYRREAIAWAREARACQAWPILPRPACIRLAKSYLAIYRTMKGVN